MSGNKDNSGIARFARFAAALAAVCAVVGFIWILRSDTHDLPQWIEWKNVSLSDASGQYEVVLKRRAVKVIYGDSVIWTSAKDIKVQDAMSCDIDGDGADELVLLCWKIGRFGTSKPFWVEEDEETWSQHIFVYSYDEDGVKPKWMSSYIGVDVVEISATSSGGVHAGSPADGGAVQSGGIGQPTGRQHLLLTEPDGRVSSWVWDSWGFTKEDTDISFVVFGDNLMHEPIYQYGLHNYNGNFDFLFENKEIKNVITQSDVAIINQETPLTDEPSKYSGYPRFGTPVEVGEALVEADFDVVTCATNHALDQGAAGIDFTKDFFVSNDIMCIGIQSEDEKVYRPYEVLTRNGVRFALFNYTYGTNGDMLPENKAYMLHILEDEEQVRADLAAAREETNFVMVFVHWGTEYTGQPDEFQRKWSEVFLEGKADVVVGTHPHALQPFEILQDDGGHEMLVYYSLGNYISAQQEKSCVKGGMAQFTVSLTKDGYRITEYSLQPLAIVRTDDGKYAVEYSEDSLEKILPNL